MRLTRTWKRGEVIDLQFDFPVRAAIRRARDGRDWVAFSRGPLALAAASSDDAELPRPSGGLAWLEGPDRIKGTEIPLLPYFQAGSDGAPVRTYFPLRS